MGRAAWQATVHGVANSQRWLIDWVQHGEIYWQLTLFLHTNKTSEAKLWLIMIVYEGEVYKLRINT